MSGAASDAGFWMRPSSEAEQAALDPADARLIWADWFCLLCSADCSDNTEWGRCAVPYIDKMMRRLQDFEKGGAWESEGL